MVILAMLKDMIVFVFFTGQRITKEEISAAKNAKALIITQPRK